MRGLLFMLLILPVPVFAQDTEALALALNSGREHRVDRWVKRELHRMRKGHVLVTPTASYIVHDPTFDTLVAVLRRQPGVIDAAWDKCINKLDLWPGHSRIGVRFIVNGTEHERCYSVQEGIPGVIRLPGWRPHVRKDRQHLKVLAAHDCPGFVEQQRAYCAERRR